MLRLLHKASQLHHHQISTTGLKTTIHALGFPINPHNIHSIPISSTPSSPTLDFLLNSCGLDLKVALLSAKKVTLKATQKPDLVLDILRKYGITNAQINQIVSKTPKVLTCDPDKTLKPKIEYLHAMGIPGSMIVDILNRDGRFLWKSLENTIEPCVNFLNRYVPNRREFLLALKNSCRFFSVKFECLVVQNSKKLRDYGVDDCNIMQILVCYPSTLLVASDRFEEIVEQVKEMGFDPSKTTFCYAVRTMAGMHEAKWKEKWEAYRKLGFSDEQIVMVFRRQPFCLMSSEVKIRKCVEFFTRELKWNVADICLYPMLLRLSLENRIIPRCNVMELLNAKCVTTGKLDVQSVAQVFKLSEDEFLQKFVVKYQEAVPEVVDVYRSRIDLANMEEDVLKELN